ANGGLSSPPLLAYYPLAGFAAAQIIHSGATMSHSANVGRRARSAARRALFTVCAVRSAVDRRPRERANPRANAGRLQATPSYARRLSNLVKRPPSHTEPRPPTPRRGLGVKGSPVQIRPSRLVIEFFQYSYTSQEPTKEPSSCAMALLETCAPIGCHGVLPGHVPTAVLGGVEALRSSIRVRIMWRAFVRESLSCRRC